MSERERLRGEAAGWGCFIAKQKTGKEVEEWENEMVGGQEKKC